MGLSKEFLQKFIIMTSAILLMGLALSFLIRVNWGIDPGSFMVRSLSMFFGISFGVMSLIIYGVMLFIMVLFGRNLLGVGTIVNMTLVGNSADLFLYIQKRVLSDALFTDASFLALKVAVFVLSIALFIVAAAVYMKCNIGIAPYDAMCLILNKRVFKNAPFAPIRMTYDFSVVALGVAFCVKSNPELLKSLPVAVIMVFTVGPVITIVSSWMEKHFALFR